MTGRKCWMDLDPDWIRIGPLYLDLIRKRRRWPQKLKISEISSAVCSLGA